MTFVINPQFAMTAARRDNNCCERSFGFCWEIRRERRIMHIRDDVFAVRSDAHGFFFRFSFCARRAVRPEQDLFRLIRREGDRW